MARVYMEVCLGDDYSAKQGVYFAAGFLHEELTPLCCKTALSREISKESNLHAVWTEVTTRGLNESDVFWTKDKEQWGSNSSRGLSSD